MTIAEMTFAILMFAISGTMIIVSIRSFRNRGYLFNNSYLYASKEDREKMDKKPYYRQTAIVFLLLSIVFIIIGVSIVLQNYSIVLFEIPFIIGAVIYAIFSTMKIRAKGQQ